MSSHPAGDCGRARRRAGLPWPQRAGATDRGSATRSRYCATLSELATYQCDVPSQVSSEGRATRRRHDRPDQTTREPEQTARSTRPERQLRRGPRQVRGSGVNSEDDGQQHELAFEQPDQRLEALDRVSASSSAWRRGSSIWTMPDSRYDSTVGSSGMRGRGVGARRRALDSSLSSLAIVGSPRLAARPRPRSTSPPSVVRCPLSISTRMSSTSVVSPSRARISSR